MTEEASHVGEVNKNIPPSVELLHPTRPYVWTGPEMPCKVHSDPAYTVAYLSVGAHVDDLCIDCSR